MISYEFLQLDLIETTGKWTGDDTVPLQEDGNLDNVLRCTSLVINQLVNADTKLVIAVALLN